MSDYYIDENGYYRYCDSDRLVHRYVAERYVVGRKLRPGEVVHHKNGNKLDNRSSNLEVMTEEEHDDHHLQYRRKKRRKKKGLLGKALDYLFAPIYDVFD